MKNFWTILFVVLIVLIGFRMFGMLVTLSFGLLRFLIPLAIVGFAVYGFLKFMQDRRY